jgi:hypothetical protein
MPSPVESAGPGITIVWNPAGLADLIYNPDGPLSEFLHAAGKIVTAGAQARALVRTGKMRDEITYELARSAKGCYVSIVSPATNPATGFPYPLVHESAHPRDRRPHRSLVPALGDIAKITESLL